MAALAEKQKDDRLIQETAKKMRNSSLRLSSSFDSIERERGAGQEESWNAEERLAKATRTGSMGHIIKYSQYVSKKDIRKLGVDKQALLRVVLDEEMQQKCALNFPMILLYLAMFIVTFQLHYGISYIFLQENQMRKSVLTPTEEIASKEDIFNWMSTTVVPYLWSSNNMNSGGKQYSTEWPTAHQELVGGFYLKTVRGSKSKCKETSIAEFDCFNEGTSVAANDPIFSGWSRSERRLLDLLQEKQRTVARWGGWFRRLTSAMGRRTAADQLEARERVQKRVRQARSSRPVKRVSLKESRRIREMQQALLDEEIEEEHRKHEERRLESASAHLLDSIPTMSSYKDVYRYAIPMSMSQNFVQAQLVDWQKPGKELITNTTLVLTIGFMLRNPDFNLGMLSNAEISFSFSRSGTIFVEQHFYTANLKSMMLVMGLLGLWAVILLAFTITSSFRLHTAITHGDVCSYFLHVPNFFEWLLVVVGWMILGFVLSERTNISWFNTQWEEYLRSRQMIPQITLNEFDRAWVDKFQSRIHTMNQIDEFGQIFVAFYHIFLVFHVLMASQGHPRMAIVFNTISQGFNDLVHLFIVFAIIFFAFVLMGMLLFGTRMEMFSTIKASLGYCMQIVLQRQYDNETIQQFDYFTSLLWIVSFVIIVVLVVVNIVLAMIFDNYGDIVNTITERDTIFHTFRRQWHHFRNYSTWVSNSKIIRSLSKAGRGELITKTRLMQLIPQMTNDQIDELYDTVKLRLVTTVVRTKKNLVPEALAAILLGVEDLRTGVRMMSYHQSTEKTEPKRETKFGSRVTTGVNGFAGDTTTARMSEYPTGATGAADTEAKNEEDDHLLGDDDLIPPQNCPVWVQDGLMKHLNKRQNVMDQLFLQIQQIRREFSRRGLGTNCDEIPIEEPEQPEREGSKRLDPSLTGEHMKPMITPGQERPKPMAQEPRPTFTPGSFGIARRMRRKNADHYP